MQQLNTVSDGVTTLTISKKQRPYGNAFTQYKQIEQREPDEVQAYVLCTSTSSEPGRIYFVAYSKATGTLIECYTVN